MAEVASAFVSLLPSARGFGSKLESQVGGEVKTSGGKVGKAFGTALKLGSVAVLGGAALAAGFLKGSLDEAREAQKVGAQTNAVIKSTGGVANVTAAGVGRLSTAISNKAGIDDEAIASGANLLLTFTNIRNEAGKGNKVFDQTVQAATDMSVALGTDTRSAAMQLGKALNDPIKGVTKLQRSGVTFTDQQKQQITTLQNSGKTLQAQKIILGEVNREFGGSAAAAATAGDKFKVAFGNLQESVGTALLPAFDGLLNIGTRFAGFLTNNVGPGMIALNGYIAPLIDGVRNLFASFSSGNGFGAFGAQVAATGAALGAFVKGLLPTLTSLGSQLGAVLGPAIRDIGNLITTQLLPAFQSMLPVILPVAKFLLTVFGGAVIGAVKGFVQALKGAINVIAGIFKLVVALVNGDWAGAWRAVVQIAKGAFNLVVGAIRVWFNVGILSIFRGGVLRLLGSWRGLWSGIRGLASRGLAAARGLVSAGINAVVRFFATGATRMLGFWRNLFRVLQALTRAGIAFIRGNFSAGLAAVRSVVSSSLARVRSLFSSAFAAIRGFVSRGIESARNAFANGVGKIITLAQGIGGKILNALSGLGGAMYAAGASLIQRLVDGVASKIGEAVAVVQNGLSRIRGLLPGSPIKWGPLKHWNNTGKSGPGGRLVGLLADGLSNTSAVDTAMTNLTKRIAVGAPRINSAVGSTFASTHGSEGRGVTFTGPLYTHDPRQLAREIEKRERMAASLAVQA